MAGKMFCYLWEELIEKDGDLVPSGECKFGERWVFENQDPEKEVRKRIRDSLGVRKDVYDDGRIRLARFWDMSELAERVGRNYKGAKFDDYFREEIGYRKGTTGEIHTLPAAEFKILVNKQIAKMEGPLPVAALSTLQMITAESIIDSFNSGSKVILADLAARFGKTIAAGAMAVEMESDLVVVASYVKTVFTSFAGDFTDFQQFSHYVHVDTQDNDYQKKITDAFAEGKKVVAYVSMHQSINRLNRIKFLFDLNVDTFLIIDEADFGIHREGQAKLLADAVSDKTRVLLMTGTNSDRSVTHWHVDDVFSVTYLEMLVQKRETMAAMNS